MYNLRAVGRSIKQSIASNCAATRLLAFLVAIGIAASAWAGPMTYVPLSVPLTNASTLEAVSDTNGDPAYSTGALGPASPIYFEGIVLNTPSTMLNGTPENPPSSIPFDNGGQWQTFVQSTIPGDSGGVALYEAQNYGNLSPSPDPTQNYTAAQFNAQVARLDSYAQNAPGTLPSPGYQMQAGDLVEVVARGALFYGGKTNINEEHTPTFDYATDPQHSFDVIYLGHPGPPTPISMPLSMIENTSSQPNFSTDITSLTNPEHYQGDLVTLMGVHLAPGQAANWVAGAGTGGLAPVMVMDSTGREFPVWLGTAPGSAPSGTFNLTGIFDQESPGGGPFNANYNLYVVSPVVASTPEPSTWALLLTGLVAMLSRKLRHRRVG